MTSSFIVATTNSKTNVTTPRSLSRHTTYKQTSPLLTCSTSWGTDNHFTVCASWDFTVVMVNLQAINLILLVFVQTNIMAITHDTQPRFIHAKTWNPVVLHQKRIQIVDLPAEFNGPTTVAILTDLRTVT
jgi:hypothetical protein